MLRILSNLSAQVRQFKSTVIFAWICRVAIALAFVPAGLKKIVGEPFTLIQPEQNTVGYFFDALLKTGFYYNFIGWAQVIAAILLFIPATRLIGALSFLAILANIVVLTWSVGFAGTKWIVLFMMLANIYLVMFDFDRVAKLFVLKADSEPSK